MSGRVFRLGIVAAEFNREVIDEMIRAAQDEARELGLEVSEVLRVPGCYELPLVADVTLLNGKIDGLVILGYIERGETLHGEVMGHVVHHAMVQLQLKYGKPIGIGIIGPGATAEQANERKTAYARAAVKALLGSLQVLHK